MPEIINMSLPFQIRKTFTTTYSEEEVIEFVQANLNLKNRFLFIPWREYVGSISGRSFNFYRNFNRRTGRSNPKISGVITATHPTTIDIMISPHYSRVLFFLIFPILVIPVAILDEQIKINGVLREPKIYERILIVLMGGGIPVIWCYFDSIRPIKKAEVWIKDRLGLQEII